MKKDRLAELQRVLSDLKIQARTDSNLTIQEFSKLFQAIQKLESAAENYERSLGEPKVHVDLGALERTRRKLAVIEAIENVRNPSYFDEFAATLAEHPYALPRALFDPQGKEVVTIDFPNNLGKQQFHRERADLALSILYPGSFTYRYFGVPLKIETGQWSQTFVAHLRMHTLSPDPIFQVKRNRRTLDVYKPITLRARQIGERNPFVCLNCLSIAGLDEGCFHSPHIKRPLKLPSSSPIIVNEEVRREEGKSTELRAPLNSLISRVTFLSSLEVGTAVLGFERSAANRVTIVDYDPPIGTILQTRAIAFRINLPDDFSDHIMQRRALVRDILLQVLAKWISEILSENNMPSYHLEPVLSGLIHALGLDQRNAELETVMNVFLNRDWVATAVQTTLAEGHAYYERFDVQPRKLQSLYDSISRRQLDQNVLRGELKTQLLHSLAHNLLIAGCVTSGCLPSDLKYLIHDDEVILFDSVDGGNGSSEMIFEFCSSKESFEMTDTEEQEEGKERIYRPKYFDAAFAELLLPCQQGVAERIFHRGFPAPTHQEIRRRFIALDKQRESYSDEYQYISEIGVEECFASSIGYHVSLTRNLQPGEAERLKEALGLCLHGCPDCLALGNKCAEGGFLEKYHVSKILLDEYFRYLTKNVTLDHLTKDSVVESLLRDRGVVILTGAISKEAMDKVGEKLQDKVSELRGTRVGQKFVKFAGFWVDSPYDVNEIRYNAMLVLV